jgi:hypothetical protein
MTAVELSHEVSHDEDAARRQRQAGMPTLRCSRYVPPVQGSSWGQASCAQLGRVC